SIGIWSGWRALRWRPTGTREGLKTGLEGSGPAASDDAAGTGAVSKHYPQASGTRPPGMALSFLQLALRLTHREAGDVDALASSGLPLVLALEIQARSTPSASRHTGVDSAHGAGKPDVGPGAHYQRTVAQARFAGVAAHRAKVYAPLSGARARHASAIPTLDNVCAQPCASDRGLRLLCGSYSDFSSPLCVPGH